MVASGDKRRARGRAERRGVERIVTQTILGQLVKRRRGNRPAECARRPEAHVIGHDEQDVRRALGCGDALGEVRRGLLGRAANLSFEWLWRTRQDFLRLCRKRAHRAQRNAEGGGDNDWNVGGFHDDSLRRLFGLLGRLPRQATEAASRDVRLRSQSQRQFPGRPKVSISCNFFKACAALSVM